MSQPDLRSPRITWVEIGAAALVFWLIVIAERGKGGEAVTAALILRGLGVSIFLLFAVWFTRAVRTSIRMAPDYALFGYAALAFCLLSWGLAFLYPFPIRNWREAVGRDLAFHAGVIAPWVALLALGAIKIIWSPEVRQRLPNAFAQKPHRWKLAIAAILLVWFPIFFGLRVVRDARDLGLSPLETTDTVISYFHGTRSGERTVTFAAVGELRLPHGLWFRSIQHRQTYQILYTRYGRLLVGVQPLNNQ